MPIVILLLVLGMIGLVAFLATLYRPQGRGSAERESMPQRLLLGVSTCALAAAIATVAFQSLEPGDKTGETALAAESVVVLAGHVADEQGVAVQYARVRITGPLLPPENTASLDYVTGPDGAFKLMSVLPGAYNILITASGFEPKALASGTDIGNINTDTDLGVVTLRPSVSPAANP